MNDPNATTDSFAVPVGAAEANRAADATVHFPPVASATALVPTALLPTGERYQFVGEIARGGMGVVYRAHDRSLDREVAVKVLQEHFGSGSSVAGRFADEARITGQLQHPGIPPVHDLGILADGRPFLAMKLIQGDTLEELLNRRTDLSDDRGRFVAVFEQVCQAIGYAHAQKVIHRDLKPANIMVGSYGEVQVMDWGLAKVLGHPQEGSEQVETKTERGSAVRSLRDTDGSVTQAGSVLGTPSFMPPEQAAGAVALVDERSDVFGLGAVLAVILTGQPPFDGRSVEAIRIQSAQGAVQACFERLDRCGADPDLIALCKRCLNPMPADRPADGGVVAAAVAALRHAADERARRAEGEKAAAEVRAAEQRKRRKIQAVLGMAFTALVLLIGAFAWWVHDQRRTRQELAEREVNQATAAAEARYAQALGADRDLALWAEARAAALAARKRAAEAPPHVRDRLDKLLAEIEQVEKNRRLVATLLDIQASMGDVMDSYGNQNFLGANARYDQAFREYGTDFSRLSPEEGAALLRNLGGRSNVELAAAIDDWAYVRWFVGVDPIGRLFGVTRLLDPDPLRNQIRNAVQARDYAALTRLADEIDPATQPSQTVNLICVWMLNLRPNAANPDAMRFLRKAQPHHPSDFQINHNLAWILLSEEQTAEALPYAMAAVAIRPRSSAAWFITARSFGGLRRDAEAAAAFRRGVALSPGAWSYLLNSGEMLERQGRQEEALADYRASIAGFVRYSATQAWALDRGFAKWKQHGLVDELATLLGKKIQEEPDNALLHYQLANILTRDERADEARASFKAACQLWEKKSARSPEVQQYLANSYLAQGRANEAISSLTAVWERAPSNTILLLKVSALQVWFRHSREYAVLSRKALASGKDSTDPFKLEQTAKACCLHNTEAKLAAATLACARKAVMLGTNNPYLQHFLVTRGMAEYRAGRFQEADDTLKPLAAPEKTQDSAFLTAAFYRAMALFRRGQQDEARNLAREAATRMKPVPRDENNPLAGNANHDDLILWLAHREAMELLEPKR